MKGLMVFGGDFFFSKEEELLVDVVIGR